MGSGDPACLPDSRVAAEIMAASSATALLATTTTTSRKCEVIRY